MTQLFLIQLLLILFVSGGHSFLHRSFFTGFGLKSKQRPDYNHMAPHLIIAGPPSVGKGTLCNIIGNKLGLVHISAGDMFRESIKAQNKIGRKVAKYVQNGRLVPDKVVIAMINDRLAQTDCVQNGWLLDGYPRSEKQAQSLSMAGHDVDSVIVLDAPPTTILERGLGRCIDPVDGKVYHKIHNPPPSSILHRIIERPDDTKETLLRRYDEYKKTIERILRAYGSKVHIIDASRDMDTYIYEVNSLLDSLVDSKRRDEKQERQSSHSLS
jgi:adenylate kinase